MRMLGAGKRDHGESVRNGSKVLLQLMRRPAGRDEMHFVKINAPVGGARHDEVTTVNGIKRTAKERDAARMMFCGGAVRLRSGQ